MPNRYVSGFGVDPANPNHVNVAINGFSRKWTEGPGAGVGHVFESRDGGALGGHLGEPAGRAGQHGQRTCRGRWSWAPTWRRLPRPGRHRCPVLGRDLPPTTVIDVEAAGDGHVYVATHGRGIWSIPLP